MVRGHEGRGVGDVGERGCAGQRGIKGGWDNCNSIMKIYFKKLKK